MKILFLIITIFLSLRQNSDSQTGKRNDFGQCVNDGYGNYLFVPAGKFSMGDNYNEGNPRESPAHPVYLDSYYVGEFEVTNEAYKKFMDDGGYSNRAYWSSGAFNHYQQPLFWNNATYRGGGLPGNENFPVVGVSWYEAKAYCAWLSEKTDQVYRLPTEAEWEKAARGGDFLDGDDVEQVPNPFDPPRRYPWGNEIDGSYSNFINSGDPFDNGLTPVGYYNGSTQGYFSTSNNSSPYGAYDMAGNVYEWCNDLYHEDYYQECFEAGTVSNPQGPVTSTWGPIIRGSAFLYEIFKHRCAYRGSYYPSARKEYIGIRCVREVDASSVIEDGHKLPESCMLHQNYPNPFNSMTTIQFKINNPSSVLLKIYRLDGQEVSVLVKDALKEPGNYKVKWNGKDKRGTLVSSGIYIYRLVVGGQVHSRKMMLVS